MDLQIICKLSYALSQYRYFFLKGTKGRYRTACIPRWIRLSLQLLVQNYGQWRRHFQSTAAFWRFLHAAASGCSDGLLSTSRKGQISSVDDDFCLHFWLQSTLDFQLEDVQRWPGKHSRLDCGLLLYEQEVDFWIDHVFTRYFDKNEQPFIYSRHLCRFHAKLEDTTHDLSIYSHSSCPRLGLSI